MLLIFQLSVIIQNLNINNMFILSNISKSLSLNIEFSKSNDLLLHVLHSKIGLFPVNTFLNVISFRLDGPLIYFLCSLDEFFIEICISTIDSTIHSFNIVSESTFDKHLDFYLSNKTLIENINQTIFNKDPLFNI